MATGERGGVGHGPSSRVCVGTADGQYVHRGLGKSGPCVATLDGDKWLHGGIGTSGPLVASIDSGKYVQRGSLDGSCIGTFDGRYVHRGIGTNGTCLGTVDGGTRTEILALGAALAAGLLG